MSINGRRWIRWLEPSTSTITSTTDDDGEENTSTLVLTSRKNNYFTDVRVLDPNVLPRTGAKEFIPSPPSPILTSNAPPPVPCPILEWAFAGNSESKVLATDRDGYETKDSIWYHWLDSQSDTPEEDRGTMKSRPGSTQSVELGRMRRPETNEPCDYKEKWQEYPVEGIPRFATRAPTPGSSASQSGSSSRARSQASTPPPRPKVSMVLRAENESLSIRGMVVRVGGWVQGVIKAGGVTSAERWKYSEASGLKHEGWEQLLGIGACKMPCRVLWEKSEELEVGEEVQSGGLKWVCVEKEIWE